MKNSRRKLDNRGASLIAVMVAITVVGIMGVIISQMTITNIQMKDVEQFSKMNFYNSEIMMDAVSTGLNKLASGAMKEAYTEMLSSYRTEVVDSGEDVEEVFAKKYLEKLIDIFKTTDGSLSTSSVRKRDDADEKDVYEIGYYSLAKVKEALVDTGVIPDDGTVDSVVITDTYGSSDDAVAYYHADFENAIFVLQGIKITWSDTRGNNTTIATDIVLHTPEIGSLDGSSGLMRDFMRYSLIADQRILVKAKDIQADGNVYAGPQGIVTEGAAIGSFIGKKIITRGDITVNSNGFLQMGDPSSVYRSQIWAENLHTVKTTIGTQTADTAAKLNLSGTTYVSDDLEIDGECDQVKLSGEYYGYNLQQNYAGSADNGNKAPSDAMYSSSISINGKECKLDISNLGRLYVAGKNFIGRNSGTAGAKDVPLGESLSVRSNQIAYFVPTTCVEEIGGRKMVKEEDYKFYLGITDSTFVLSDYLDPTENIIEYYYTYNGSVRSNYYLKFKNEQAANDYYFKFYQHKLASMNRSAEGYLTDDALIFGSISINSRGDILFRDASSLALGQQHVSIDALWNEGAVLFNQSASFAVKYNSLQKYLDENHSGIGFDSVRIDKDADMVFSYIINDTKLTEYFTTHPGGTVTAWTSPSVSGTKLLAIVDGDYTVPSDYDGGLVIANGNVNVACGTGEAGSFKGTIIARNTIQFNTNNSWVAPDEATVSAMIADDIRNGATFAYIFNGFEEIDDQVIGGTSINKYLTYDNWTKTVE